MISKTLRSEIVGILKSAELPAFFAIYEIHQTGLIGFSIDGVINDVISNGDKMLIEYVGYFFWDRIARPWLGTSFKSLVKLLTFNLFKGRYVTVKIRSKQGSFMKYDAKIFMKYDAKIYVT